MFISFGFKVLKICSQMCLFQSAILYPLKHGDDLIHRFGCLFYTGALQTVTQQQKSASMQIAISALCLTMRQQAATGFLDSSSILKLFILVSLDKDEVFVALLVHL